MIDSGDVLVSLYVCYYHIIIVLTSVIHTL
jgi:hypothetical protein